MSEVKDLLIKKDYTFVCIKEDEKYVSNLHGIAPIMIKLEEDSEYFKDSIVADRVIGKAAAMLLIMGGIKKLYAKIISRHALDILKLTDIEIEFDKVVPYIINRTGDGICPMEETVLTENNCEEAYQLLKQKLTHMKQNNK